LETSALNRNKLLFFFDESRFGTHSKIGHGWFPAGKRTAVEVKLGFKNFYLYSAVNPETGDHFTLQMPSVNTDCMNAFLHEMAEHYKDKEILLVMDGAGWHKSKDLQIPQTIEIIKLPPYSPELNPVETLWQHIKYHTIRNKIYDTLQDLEETICTFVNNIKPETIISVCSMNAYK